MGSMKFLDQLQLQSITTLDTPSTGFVTLASKTDGLYQKVGTNEDKLATKAYADLGNLGLSNLNLSGNRTVDGSTNTYGIGFTALNYFKTSAFQSGGKRAEFSLFPVGEPTKLFEIFANQDANNEGSPFVDGLTTLLRLGFYAFAGLSSAVEVAETHINYTSAAHIFTSGTVTINDSVEINADVAVDGDITCRSFNTISGISVSLPLIDATTAVVGVSARVSREDHQHPTDTTRQAAATAINTGNIATQSVSYATSAANSTNLGGYGVVSFAGYIADVTDVYNANIPNNYGFFYANTNSTNNPSPGDWVQGIQFPIANNTTYRQLLISSGNGNLYFGCEGAGIWKPWEKILTDVNSANMLNQLKQYRFTNDVACWVRIAKLSAPMTGEAFGNISITNGYYNNVPSTVNFNFGTSYRSTGCYINQFGGINLIITKARIVFPLLADTDYYIEVYANAPSTNNNYSINLSNSYNVSLYSSYNTGSIPTGYGFKECSFINSGIVTENLTTNGTINSNGVINVNGNVLINPVSASSNYLQFQNNGTSIGTLGSDAAIYGGTSTNVGLYVYGSNDLSLSTNNTKQLTIKGNGNVLIGTTSDNGSKLQVNGTISATSFNSITGLATATPQANGTAAVGTSTLAARQDHVHAGGSLSSYVPYTGATSNLNMGTTYTVTANNFILASDKRLKTNIESISNNPIDIQFKEFEMISNPGEKRYGVIAQELQEVAPELVNEDSDGMLSVKYIDLLIRKIAELESRIKIMEDK